MYVNPTLQLLCGVFLFHETFTRTYAVMFAFVWAAVVLYLASAWAAASAEALSAGPFFPRKTCAPSRPDRRWHGQLTISEKR